MLCRKLKQLKDLIDHNYIICLNGEAFYYYFIQSNSEPFIVKGKEAQFLFKIINKFKAYQKENIKGWQWCLLYKNNEKVYDCFFCVEFEPTGYKHRQTIKNKNIKVLVYEETRNNEK